MNTNELTRHANDTATGLEQLGPLLPDLAKAIRMLTAQAVVAAERIPALETENRMLREALTPFAISAALAEIAGDDRDDDTPVSIPLGCLRRASAAMLAVRRSGIDTGAASASS